MSEDGKGGNSGYIPSINIDWQKLREHYPVLNLANEMNSLQRKDIFILRAHITAEKSLEKILDLYFPNYKEGEHGFNFIEKKEIADMAGIFSEKDRDNEHPNPIINNLNLLNQARNKFAHNYDTEKTFEDKVENKLDGMEDLEFPDEIQEFSNDTQESFGKKDQTPMKREHTIKINDLLMCLSHKIMELED